MHAWALPLPSASTNLLPALFVERLESQERPPAPQRASIVRTVHHSSTNTSNQSGLRGPAYRRIKVAVKLTAVEIDDLDRDGRRVGHRACTHHPAAAGRRHLRSVRRRHPSPQPSGEGGQCRRGISGSARARAGANAPCRQSAGRARDPPNPGRSGPGRTALTLRFAEEMDGWRGLALLAAAVAPGTRTG